jgi:2-phospho-L-lactate guanylyltransferase
VSEHPDRDPLPDADLTRIHVLVPLRTVEGGKARLGEALDAEEREELVIGMLRHLLAEVRAWGGAVEVEVVSPDPDLLAVALHEGARPLRQRTFGLNAGLRLATGEAKAGGATAVLILPGDLPLVSAVALERLVDAADAALAAGSGRPVVVVVPADARGGTNAILLAPPDAIEPAFGEGSLAAHLRAAEAAHASVQVVADPALSFDLDTPEDLERLEPDLLARLQALGRATVVEG